MEVCPFPLSNCCKDLSFESFLQSSLCWLCWIIYLTHLSGQVLRRENISEYINLNVPSLKSFSVIQANGDGKSSLLRLLANAMQIIKR